LAIAGPFGDGRHTNHAVPPLYGTGTARYSLTSARSAYIEGNMTGKWPADASLWMRKGRLKSIKERIGFSKSHSIRRDMRRHRVTDVR
jgi:hypothetical protein